MPFLLIISKDTIKNKWLFYELIKYVYLASCFMRHPNALTCTVIGGTAFLLINILKLLGISEKDLEDTDTGV